MIVDSSAIIAILRAESDARRVATAIELSEVRKISAANYVEIGIVIDAERNPVASRRVDDVIAQARIQIVAVTEAHARIAREAYRDFGKGSGHPARLNYGDCFAYALAKEAGEPLLFKGDDFSKTGIEAA